MKLIFAAAVATAMLAVGPASAAKMMTCAGDGPMKMNAMVTGMQHGPSKWAMQKQVAMVNASMSKGDMRGCNKAMMTGQRMAMKKGK